MNKDPIKTYEEMFPIVDALIKSRRNKWRLRAIAWMDYSDVEQVIRLHIFKKWHLWDQKRAIQPWINRIVSNQIKNIIRNLYSSVSRPCLNCSFNESKGSGPFGEKSCSATPSGTQCNECPLYAKWEKSKKAAHDLKLPVSLENHKNYHQSIESTKELDYLVAENNLHQLIKAALTDKQFFIYKMFFIDCLTDEEIAKILKFKTSEVGRKAGYKQIKNIKNMLYIKAKLILAENDVFE
jgi:DNA-directed RNA polymerase specialized sigma24 family protein